MAKHSRKRSAHRKYRRSTHRKGSRSTHRFQQRGGDGYGYQGAAFAPAGPMAPIESRVGFSHCGFPTRPGSLVGGARHKGSHRKGSRSAQRGGACGSCSAPAVLMGQTGGGGGTGGYGFDITNNSMGKEYAALTVGSCPGSVRPGAQVGGADMIDTRVVDSYPAGYGYAPESAVEVGHGTAHYLNQLPYGRQCMGGGRRKSRRGGKKSRKAGRR